MVKKKALNHVWLIAFLMFSITLTGCIDVLHIVRVNKNSLSIQYRIALSKQITGMQENQQKKREKRRKQRLERLQTQREQLIKQRKAEVEEKEAAIKQREVEIKQREEKIKQGQPLPPLEPLAPLVLPPLAPLKLPPPVVKKKSPMENMGDSFSDFRKKNRRLLMRYKAGEINSEMEVGWKANFSISKRNSNKIKPSENPPLTPRYDAKRRRLVFEFKSNPMEKGKKKKPNQKSGGGIDESAAAIFSTALYTIVITGNSRAKSAYIQKIGGKTRQQIEVIKSRGFSIVKFPWISMFLKHQQYRVVIQL